MFANLTFLLKNNNDLDYIRCMVLLIKHDLWLGGKKLEKGAFVAVSLYGNASADSYNKMTGQICALFSEKLGIPADSVYVTYHPVSDWGWNGQNF